MNAETIFIYPVNDKHSTVLGYGARSKDGARMWRKLHWRGAWKDGPGAHMFNPYGGEYLHVRTKPLEDACWYRVRCAHYIGSRWRGGVVRDVAAIASAGKWFWHVTIRRRKAAAL